MMAFGPPVALADPVDAVNYTINFTLHYGTPPTAGSFTYDPDTPNFTNFLVTWDGAMFNLTSAANSPGIIGAPACLHGATGAAASFLLLNGSCSPPPVGGSTAWNSISPDGLAQNAFFGFFTTDSTLANEINVEEILTNSPIGPSIGAGQWTLTQTTPEPSAYFLMLAGLGLLGLMRKQIIPAGRNKS
jgi:hypothetical protein